MTTEPEPETGRELQPGERVPTGHDWKTEVGQRALANPLMYGAQAGSAQANVAEVMERHRPMSTPSGPHCAFCREPWRQGRAAVEGCSIYLLADAIEGVLWVASNRPPETEKKPT